MASADAVLLVNDIPDHKHLYDAALRARGYEVILTTTGVEALARAADVRPSCIVIDERLPDMTGWDLCRRLKAHASLASIPVVMLTQELSRDSGRHSRDAGCASWLARPTVADDVVRAIEHVLAQDASAPENGDAARLGVRECPGCESERIRAGVRVGAVQYYVCSSCGLRWRVEAQGEAIA